MSFVGEVDLGPDFAPFAAFRQLFGYVPALFRAQSLLPRAIEAEAAIGGAVVFTGKALSRTQKEYLLLVVSAAERSVYCVTEHAQALLALGEPQDRITRALDDFRQAGLPDGDVALIDLALKAALFGPYLSRCDIRDAGLSDEGVLETVLTAGLGRFRCGLATGLGVRPDSPPATLPTKAPSVTRPPGIESSKGPYLMAPSRTPEEFPPFAFFLKAFGFIPNIFRAQTLRPDVLEAETVAIGNILLTQDVLTRVQKEYILLVISAANLNTYCVAVHCEMLRALGVPEDDSDQIAVDHHLAPISAADKALLDFSLKLATRSSEFGAADIDSLRNHGFSDPQIVEAVVMSSLTSFLNTLQMGLGTTPDFRPRRVFHVPREENQPPPDSQPYTMDNGARADPDWEWVERVRSGNVDAFEVLVERHSSRIYRTLVGILGSQEEAREALQDTFLKAYQHLPGFQKRSRFSTWLVSIAGNTAMQRLRDREPVESLDEETEGFQPRQVREWRSNPEQIFERKQLNALVESNVLRLPVKYRAAVILRDLQQMSSEEAATALGLGVPALKARVLRGRLMLREALAPYFATEARGEIV
jgi:RNA polymerase sigma-70 factor (ECF subfamily)